MRYCVAILAVGLAVAFVSVAPSAPPPQPEAVPASWELDFESQTPQMISLKMPGEAGPRTFWYVLYTVANSTEKAQIFVPDFLLYTDTGQIARAGKGVPAAVFEAIQKRHNNPLLVDIAAVTGRILPGEDNTKDSVAVWSDFDPKARGFDIFVAGLSGEEVSVALPAPVKVTVRKDGGEKVQVTRTEIVLAKTLRLAYKLPGEAAARGRTKPRLLEKQWVMR
jgi:hypothetical protein